MSFLRDKDFLLLLKNSKNCGDLCATSKPEIPLNFCQRVICFGLIDKTPLSI